jgi:hypothetical protein
VWLKVVRFPLKETVLFTPSEPGVQRQSVCVCVCVRDSGVAYWGLAQLLITLEERLLLMPCSHLLLRATHAGRRWLSTTTH